MLWLEMILGFRLPVELATVRAFCACVSPLNLVETGPGVGAALGFLSFIENCFWQPWLDLSVGVSEAEPLFKQRPSRSAAFILFPKETYFTM